MKLALNLATRSYPNRRAFSAGVVLLLVISGVALLSNLVGLLRESNQYRRHSDQLTMLEQSLAQIKPETVTIYTPEALELQRVRITLANRLLEEDTFRWTALLDRLEGVLPAGVRLSSITPSFKDGGVRINGSARDIATLRAVLDRLLVSEYFTDVRLARQSRVEKQGRGASVQFNLSLIWKEKATL